MKKHHIIYLTLSCFLWGCSSIKFIPHNINVHQTTFGSYIDIKTLDKQRIKGEIIEVTDEEIMVLDLKFKIEEIKRKDIKKYKLVVAENTNYALPSLLLQAITLSHGLWAFVTFPITAVNILIVNSTASNAFTFSAKEIPYDDLYLFARFPQGIPDEVEIENLNRRVK
jgi:hypothetical protein